MEHVDRKALITRFAKIEGHVRSIKNMTEEERDFEMIMQQIGAVKKAMDAAAKVIYTEQMKELIKQGEIDEVIVKKKIDSYIR
ncbi:metal-sensitive transcriptional regulator [Listeria sp. FSL L7-1485]|uniref:Metal-sensitive transcriptional regulator n=1 Tax=Listeria immobilis TaxID=2713502 RepID=A0A7X0X5N2_9LIST|nr:metal-sensitive transcriptional regulator [Listeria immobilis]MBC1483725.1 metal-sensitive transcriptional regulator [Listeria immobilis]MBC1488025.1 metal-sensitive transcriptional regulator [Listeria immobilis]MBC1506452.1 metal-sensitive transcriptional regulator [Listeria immobilis]MBC1509264.1 metal-sensitive transcriptional regulator [Listeria immobilis]MBC1516423.1 metal-sensitive transcriptional regulator [Listeria immobilis]